MTVALSSVNSGAPAGIRSFGTSIGAAATCPCAIQVARKSCRRLMAAASVADCSALGVAVGVTVGVCVALASGLGGSVELAVPGGVRVVDALLLFGVSPPQAVTVASSRSESPSAAVARGPKMSRARAATLPCRLVVDRRIHPIHVVRVPMW